MKGIIVVFLLNAFEVLAQNRGCTDFRANNYDKDADINNGSCTYDKTSYSPKTICPQLSDTIIESSGLIYFQNSFWTINDSDNPAVLYSFDSISGKIKHQTYIADESNIDWEDLTQDSLYIYIGDFGNNRGNRTDLRILKIKKSDINLSGFQDTVRAELIRFKMNDQIIFNHSPQAHNYDMEAFFVLDDSIHLFSKNWADKKSRHYVCPTDTGTFDLKPVETLDVNGQITGACVSENGTVVLCGYNKGSLGSFMVLMWDHKSNRFNTGNRRRIEVGNLIVPGQNEAVCMRGKVLYMSNEKQISNAALHRLDINDWVQMWGLGFKSLEKNEFKFYLKETVLYLENIDDLKDKTILIYDSSGRLVQHLKVENSIHTLATASWAKGVYLIVSDEKLLYKIYIP